MKATAAVREIMNRKGIGLMELAGKTGKSKQVTYERLSQENISVTKLNEMLTVMGYKVMIVPEEVDAEDGWYDAE